MNKVWKWTDKRSPGEVATINKPYSSLLMGKAVADFTQMNVSLYQLFFRTEIALKFTIKVRNFTLVFLATQ